jgi:hypothetical protein
MPKTIKELKKLWETEKQEYVTQEVGCGVQRFVKEVLRSPELFNLKVGELATKDEKRRHEFLEEKARQAKRADVIVYIDSDIIIPIEVEKYNNIEAGYNQLLNYQLVWDKKYGILTDGYKWQFFNNALVIKEYTIDAIFTRPDEFLEFWKEYIKPENYYLSFFENVGQIELFEEKNKVDDKRLDFFTDITTLIESFYNKLKIKGYFEKNEKKSESESIKQAVEITYAYIIQFILFKTLVDNDFGNFKKDFDQRIKTIYAGLKSKSYKEIITTIKGISSTITKNVYRPFSKEQEFINKQLEEILDKPKSELTDVSPWLDIFIFIKRYNFSNIQNEIFGYIYENYLKDLYSEGQKGQYFTDPAVVNFMLNQVGYNAEEIKKQFEKDKDSISLIDPSCGSGTFLYSATNEIMKAIPNGSEQSSKKIEEIVNNNIFGLDIAEFPLYLAEMNIIMRMLPIIINEKYNNPIDKKIKVFKTRDSISEFLDTALRNTMHDLHVDGQTDLFHKNLSLGYSSYMREENDLGEMKKSLESKNRCNRSRFDFVIGNPPYIGYNKCASQGLLYFNLMKKGLAKLNDVYGVNLHSVPNNPKRNRPNPNLYAFFIALGISLLKDNGKLCYIIPQTILTAGDLDVLRYHLAKHTTIEKIILFSGKMFIGRGLKQNRPVPTSSLIFVIKRKIAEPKNKVEVMHFKGKDEECIENILNSKNVKITQINQKELLANCLNWNFLTHGKSSALFASKYISMTEDMSNYYLHSKATKLFNSKFYFDSGYGIDEKLMLNEKPNGFNYLYPKINNDLFTIKYAKGFWPDARSANLKMSINLRQANQGYNLLDSKYKIVWSYANPNKFFFADLPIIWARNQYCAIGSENKRELLYLFSLLNSKVNTLILRNNLLSENEKDLLIATKSIKQYVRIPKRNEYNEHIIRALITNAESLVMLDDKNISDYVDFTGIMVQKFDTCHIENKNIILKRGDDTYKCKILKEHGVVAESINVLLPKELIVEDERISLAQLKSMPAIDFKLQKQLKDYIDDLVYSLYFNIDLKDDIEFDKADKIKAKCKKHEFYDLVTGQE